MRAITTMKRHQPPSSRSSRSGDSQNFHGIPKAVLPFAGHAASSAVGSALSNFVTYPFELVSTRLKVQRQVIAQRQRMTKDRRKIGKGKRRSRSSSSSSSSDIVKKESSGSSSGATKRISIEEEKDGVKIKKWEEHDGDEIRVTWETEYDDDEMYDGHFDAFSKIYDKEGISGFYHGIGWDTVGQVTTGLWYFAVYNLLRHHRKTLLGNRHGKLKNLPVLEELGIGIAAAAVSKFVSSPFSNIVTRKQTAAMLYPNARAPSVIDIYHDIMREHGITGFWSGYSASLLLTLNPSITFLIYEAVKPHAREHRGRNLDAIDTFLLAAACKAIATTLTYPLVVVRTRAQLEGDEHEMEMEEMFEGAWSKGRGKKGRKKLAAVRKVKGIVDILVEVIKKEGITALYVGIGGELIKGFLSGGVTTMVKEAVHSSILRLYFFVLDAYKRSEYGSYRSTAKVIGRDIYSKAGPKQKKLIDKTRSGAEAVQHVAGSGRRAIHGTKESVEHLGHKVAEKAHIGRHNHAHGHSHEDHHRHGTNEQFEDAEIIREERIHEERLGGSRGRSERDIIDERLMLRNKPHNHETSIHEEHIEISDVHRSRGDSRMGDERLITSRENVRSTPSSRAVSERAVVRATPTPSAAPAMERRHSFAAPKAVARVERWMDKVEKETTTASQEKVSATAAPAAGASIAAESMAMVPHPALGSDRIERTTVIKETNIDQMAPPPHQTTQHTQITRRFPVRESSIASGQSYRAPSGRTSLIVNPPASIHQRRDWIEESRGDKAHGGRFTIGGGDVAIGGQVRGSSPGLPQGQWWEQEKAKFYK
ncbi:mitochondrial carrier domain-containing protein [Geopyxis carbonaria]|nr:mitochondrial carrier domain-containing protein [Geopyxis carbonaria]